MAGSAENIGCPNEMLNTIVAEELEQFADVLEKADDFDKAVIDVIRKTYQEHKRIVFNGDNYSDEWLEEAERRGLYNLRSMPEAMPHYVAEKNLKFQEARNLTEAEVRARYEIQLENYSKIINIEALTTLDMAKKDIVPAVVKYLKLLADSASVMKSIDSDICTCAETELKSFLHFSQTLLRRLMFLIRLLLVLRITQMFRSLLTTIEILYLRQCRSLEQ